MAQYDEMVIAGIERACEKHPYKTALLYLGRTVRVDEDAEFFYVDRSADIIKYKGKRKKSGMRREGGWGRR